MLSSPFSSSASSMKSSLLSLLHPNQSSHQDLDAIRRLSRGQPLATSHSVDEQQLQHQRNQQPNLHFLLAAPTIQTNNSSNAPNKRPAKSVKMKLFEQPLDKLFSHKAMKQLNDAIKACSSPLQASPSAPTNVNTLSRDIFFANIRKTAGIRKFNTDANNNTNSNVNSSSNSNNNNNGHCNNHKETIANQLTASQRQELILGVLPQPIKNLLNELYLRGPSTVGIFRKSPNAKHCKELRHKLETDSQSSIEEFQVTVIASVFKEWLRSLPDCLLMSRLYPQWIDVAKLIEPLYQQQQLRLHQEQTQLTRHHQSQSLEDDSYSDNTISCNTSLRPSRSPLTDNGACSGEADVARSDGQLVNRAHSCSTMASEFSLNKLQHQLDSCDIGGRGRQSSSPNNNNHNSSNTMTAFALSERRSECLRIVGQLLDALNEPNLILLRSFISVLWRIASNSEHNKMSASNLGVCVGQSLLNDEHRSSSKSTGPTFTRRHRRTRSQSILSSTLSLTSISMASYACYLESSGAQETAKYVPMLVAFMIENAPALFGEDITGAFMPSANGQHEQSIESGAHSPGAHSPSSSLSMDYKENRSTTSGSSASFDQVDSGLASPDETSAKEVPVSGSQLRQQIVVEGHMFKPIDTDEDEGVVGLRPQADAYEHEACLKMSKRDCTGPTTDASATTSILIVNTPQKRQTTTRSQWTQTPPLSAYYPIHQTNSSPTTTTTTAPSHNYAQRANHPLVASHQQASVVPTLNYAASRQQSSPLRPNHHHQHNQQQPQPQPQYHPMFYSTTNLSSLQHQQHQYCEQQDGYLLCYRDSLKPQRSHVLSLRDHYLSLQQSQQRQQREQNSYRLSSLV